MKDMEWELKKDAVCQNGSDGFWYDLILGGYIKPELILSNGEQLKQLQKAIALVKDFEQMLEAEGLMEEF